MIRFIPFLPLPLVLAACVPVPATSPSAAGQPAPASYFALGTEPGWALEITPARLNYTGDHGDTRIVVANPGARPSFNGSRYVTDRLTIDVTHSACNDAMSDRRYADTVTIVADGKTGHGCGGAVLPSADPDSPQGTG